MEDAAQFEGLVVDEKFPLRRHLGGGVRSAVFLTQHEGANAAIKFVPYAEPQLEAWKAAAPLDHPNLIRIFAGGEYRLGETDCAYVVTEYADDSLAPTLAERHLTVVEAGGTFLGVASALAYLHGQGFAHGHVKASNIMGVGDRVALSSDTVTQDAGASAPEDCRALGAILRQAIPSLPAPFLEIAQHCQEPDPHSRWTAAMVEKRLRGGSNRPEEPAAGSAPPRPTGQWLGQRMGHWTGTAVAAVLLILAIGGVWLARGRTSSPAPTPAEVGEITKTAPKTPPKTSSRTAPGTASKAAPQPAVTEGVLDEIMPEIPQEARNTITGRVRINVRVSVDAAGNVSEAVLEPPKASKYFSDRVLAAARRWKFRPTATAREWHLRFELLPRDTKVAVSPAA